MLRSIALDSQALPPNRLPESCVAASQLRAEDDFNRRRKSTATESAEEQCAADQVLNHQQAWHDSQETQMHSIEFERYRELEAQREEHPSVVVAQATPAPRAPQVEAPHPTPPPVQSTVSGSCFFVSADGIVVTNHHVVEGARSISVIDANNTKYEATILRDYVERDLALLDVPGASKHAALAFDETGRMSLGQQVFTIGYPLPNELGSDPKYFEGVVAGLRGLISTGCSKSAFRSSRETQVVLSRRMRD
ncbi:MAG TPA: serine protease [Kofleriaceae bacterium]|nr:serine protease [Kofleriaceae bacterium]